MGPFQEILGNFQAIGGLLSGNFGAHQAKKKTSFNLPKKKGEDCTPKKVSTSTIAALFPKMALTGERIAMVDMVLLVFQHFHIYRRGGGGGRYFSVP